MHSSLKTKLVLGFALVGLASLGVGLLGWKGIVDLKGSMDHRARFQDISEDLLLREIDHILWVRQLGRFESDESIVHLDVETNDHRCAFGRWLYGDGRREAEAAVPEIAPLLAGIEAPHARLHALAIKIEDLLSQGPDHRAKAIHVFGAETDSVLEEIQGVFDQLRPIVSEHVAQARDVARNGARRSTEWAMGIALAGFVVAIGTGWWISLRISRPIQEATSTLMASISETESAASQMSSVSQTLASGASEQAASLEQTSSTLEEMAGMTRQNAENAARANGLASHARHATDSSVADMEVMRRFMADISQASSQIVKIIKTIDDLAFQTNILALNAAVEAARAGEAGMGFAVVAEEVRALASRSAEAARETAGKIEGAIAKTEQGVQMSEQVCAGLADIADKIRQVDQLIGEVASATSQQSEGLELINSAISQMDQVTQDDAALAEEGASAAEELAAQAQVLKQAAATLHQVVEGVSETDAAGVAITPSRQGAVCRNRPQRTFVADERRPGRGISDPGRRTNTPTFEKQTA